MKTRMTELLGIKHPVMLAGMAFVSLPKFVAAVSNAGGIGMLNSVAYAPSGVKEVIEEVKSLTDKSFGINATLILPNARINYDGLVKSQAASFVKIGLPNLSRPREYFILSTKIAVT